MSDSNSGLHGALTASALPAAAGRSLRFIAPICFMIADGLAVTATLAFLSLVSVRDVCLALACLAAAGLYALRAGSAFQRFSRHFGALAAAGVVIAIAHAPAIRATPPALMLMPAGVGLALILSFYFSCASITLLRRLGLWGEATLLIGPEAATRDICGLLRALPELGLRPAAELRLQAASITQILSAIAMHPDHMLLFTTPETYAAVRDFLTPREQSRLLWLDADGLPHAPAGAEPALRERLICAPVTENRTPSLLMRGFDIFVSATALIAFAPVIGICAMLIRLRSGSSALYRQMRRGLHGAPVGILKLRTMYADAEARLSDHLASNAAARLEWDTCVKLRDDPRILPGIGSFLRRSSLDELPQLINILSGDIALIGPRPFPDYHLARFDAAFRAVRQSVKPGLTGLWQVSARSDSDLALQRRLDLFYIRNRTLMLDLYIFLKTPLAVWGGAGAR